MPYRLHSTSATVGEGAKCKHLIVIKGRFVAISFRYLYVSVAKLPDYGEIAKELNLIGGTEVKYWKLNVYKMQLN